MQKPYFILLIADPNGFMPDQAAVASPAVFWTPGAILFCAVGLFVLFNWLRHYGGFKALRYAPVRRNRMVGFEPVALLGVWLLLMLSINLLITMMFANATAVFRQSLIYSAMAFLEVSLIAVMALAAYFVFARRLKGFGLCPRTLGRDAAFALVYLLAVYPLILTALWVVLTMGHFLFKDFNIEVHESLTFLSENTNPALTALLVLFSVLIVPIFEEMLFRGFLQTALRSLTRSPWAAIGLTSVLFSILHPPTHILALFFLSCGLGYAYERSGSLFRCILMHIFFNGVSVAATLWAA